MLTTSIIALACNLIMGGLLHRSPGNINLHGHSCSGHHHHHGHESHDHHEEHDHHHQAIGSDD